MAAFLYKLVPSIETSGKHWTFSSFFFHPHTLCITSMFYTSLCFDAAGVGAFSPRADETKPLLLAFILSIQSKMFLATTQVVAVFFPPGRAETPTSYPQMHIHTYWRHTHTHPPQKILFVNISHVKTNFKRLLGGWRQGIMTALTRELAQLSVDATNNLSVIWKANESWRESLVSVHEDAAWSWGGTQSVKKSLLCWCVMEVVCCKCAI